MIVAYSIAPCRSEDENIPCLRRDSTWSSLSETWVFAVLLEILVEDPLFVIISLVSRLTIASCLTYEVIYKLLPCRQDVELWVCAPVRSLCEFCSCCCFD
jgi:hypothetical protein